MSAKYPVPSFIVQAPVIKDPPVLACDHAQAVIDGHGRPHMLDDVHHPSMMHKTIHDFARHMVGSVTRYR